VSRVLKKRSARTTARECRKNIEAFVRSFAASFRKHLAPNSLSLSLSPVEVAPVVRRQRLLVREVGSGRRAVESLRRRRRRSGCVRGSGGCCRRHVDVFFVFSFRESRLRRRKVNSITRSTLFFQSTTSLAPSQTAAPSKAFSIQFPPQSKASLHRSSLGQPERKKPELNASRSSRGQRKDQNRQAIAFGIKLSLFLFFLATPQAARPTRVRHRRERVGTLPGLQF